jgi:enediyne biosynthesis protein E4
MGVGALVVEANSPIVLKDVTAQTGISFQHTHGGSGRRYLVESVSTGLVLFDYDNDGDEDIYFLNGSPLRGTKVPVPPRNALYRNDGNFKFTEVGQKAGVADLGYALGATAGDYDNDGDLDLYINNYGANVLYRNNGDGTFTDVTKQANVANGHKIGAGACFLDIEKDGDLDLYVSNYVQFAYEPPIQLTRAGYPIYGSPRDYPLVPDTLYRNNGDGTFTDISQESGIGAHPGSGMGMVCGDFDNDGDTDIFVANDVSGNFLFQNDGSGKFEEVGLIAGFAYDGEGNAQGSMGVDCGDYNNDGFLDFYLTTYSHELATLYKNTGDGFLEDVSLVTGGGRGTHPYVTWGNSFVDFDNDGDKDIFIACGHIQDNVEKYDDSTSYYARNVVLLNVAPEKFENISEQCGDGLQVKLSSRGAAFDDLDNDGDIDVVVQNTGREPTILRNDSPRTNHWIQIRLRGTKTNRDGVGSQVKVATGDQTQLDEVHSGRGYQSHYGTRLHFGLGKHQRIDRIDVRWYSGRIDVHKDIKADQLIILEEGNPNIITKP